ncbi:hypothetical protein DFR70_11834 [Nocardia tenerifensis]|uniref:Uncharacterized protein n=1 Tax=Nocardia tenerifensis TaxID=228006 RepID=A0A318K3R8_9NOCA|nr:hypothetical protein DFR70_11834 [Nocardia tenerifensis]
MLALAFALTVLFEVAIQVARLNDIRKVRREAEDLAALSDEEALFEAGRACGRLAGCAWLWSIGVKLRFG